MSLRRDRGGSFAVPTRVSGLLTGVLGNSALRATTIGARSLLMVALAVWLEPAELGYFGLITAIIAFTDHLLGLDFHTFMVRDISAQETVGLRHKLRDQFVLHGIFYGTTALASWWAIPALGLERRLLFIVVLLIITQHVTLEQYRILVRLFRVLPASVTLFIRDAAWIPLCLLFWWWSGEMHLTTILSSWLAASIVSAVFALGTLSRATEAGPKRAVDWQRLSRGLRVGLRMLPGTLSMRTLLSVDRILLAFLVPPEVLGAYVFFVGICMTFHGLFVTGVLTYFWPALLEAEKGRDAEAVSAARVMLFRVCWGAPLFITLASLVVGLLAADLLPNPIYGEHLGLLAIAAMAHGLLGASNGPHYVLFSKGKDGRIVGSHLAGLAGFGCSVALLYQVDARLAVPLAVLAASLIVMVTKGWLANRILRRELQLNF